MKPEELDAVCAVMVKHGVTSLAIGDIRIRRDPRLLPVKEKAPAPDPIEAALARIHGMSPDEQDRALSLPPLP